MGFLLMGSPGYFGTFRGELINTLLVEAFLMVAIWKTWFSPWTTTIYLLACGILPCLLIRAKRIGTKDAFETVGKVAFGIIILDTFIRLVRL